MRIAIHYEMSGELLPKDYRSGFMALIKKAISSASQPLFEQYYMRHKLKPFTFSTYFPQLKGGVNGKFNVGREIRLNFSTSSLELATYLYNGFYKTRTFPLFENELTLKHISICRSEHIGSSEVIFKTASPVLVNNIGDSGRYLLPNEEGFMEGLRFAVTETAKAFLDWKEEVPLDFEIFRRDEKVSMKRKVVSHYQQSMSAFVGAFKLKSDPKILQMIYDVGLGVRRSQGFGMLEVVKQ